MAASLPEVAAPREEMAAGMTVSGLVCGRGSSTGHGMAYVSAGVGPGSLGPVSPARKSAR